MNDYVVELNADLGEGVGHDDEILDLVQRANVCLGAHAGSAELTRRTVATCKEKGVLFCAHPGYPDHEAFGRRPFAMAGLSRSDVRESLLAQLEPWAAEMASLKPHGALYHGSQHEGVEFELLVDMLVAFPVPLLGMPGTAHETAAAQAGVPFLAEGFADRGYSPAGSLIPRGVAGSFVRDDELPAHLEWLVARVRSVCVHGDGDRPVERLRAVIDWLGRNRVEICPWTP